MNSMLIIWWDIRWNKLFVKKQHTEKWYEAEILLKQIKEYVNNSSDWKSLKNFMREYHDILAVAHTFNYSIKKEFKINFNE